MNLSFLNSASNLEAALYYSQELGWPVFPLYNPMKDEWIELEIDGKKEKILKCSCGKPRCGKQTGKHPRTEHGWKDATTNPVQVKSWWTQWPLANVGIATGNQLIVIDADQRHGGLVSIQEVFTYSPNLENTLVAATGDGGFHYYATVPLAAGRIASRISLWDGIDTRSDEGYVVASPSLHRTGVSYRWTSGEATLQELDVKLIEKMRRQIREQKIDLKAESRIKIPEGQRNDALFRIACQKCSIEWSKEDTLAHIIRQNHERCDPPLDEEEIASIIDNAYKYDPSFEFNDEGNAGRLNNTHGHNLRWTPNLKWLYWEDGHWDRVDEQEVLALATDLTKQIRSLAKANNDEELLSWMKRSRNERPLHSMVNLLKHRVFLNPELINKKSLWLPVANGVYEVDTGTFRTSQREDYILKRSPITYDRTAKCPLWEQSILRWMNGDKEMADFLKRMAGYFLTGDIRHHALFIFWGSGANGKSTFTRVVESLLGPFGMAMSTDMLLKRTSISKEQEAARLFGARLAVCSESPESAMLDTERAKALTGGDRIRAKIVYSEPFDFEPTHKVLLHTNELPKLTYNDPAIWRRIKLIEFPVRIPADEQDPTLPRKLQRELPGVLNWAIEGAIDWYRSGDLGFPDKVSNATRQYREGMDQIGLALEELCEFGATDWGTKYKEKGDALYRRYVATASTWGQRPKQRAAFYEYLRAKEGIRESSKAGTVMFYGLKLKEAETAAIDLER